MFPPPICQSDSLSFYFSCCPQDVSTVSGFSSGPNWSGTLGQSQSVASIPRLSPKAETKKRRAPPPPPAPAPRMEQTTVESCQVRKQFNLCQIYVCCSLCLCFMTMLGLELWVVKLNPYPVFSSSNLYQETQMKLVIIQRCTVYAHYLKTQFQHDWHHFNDTANFVHLMENPHPGK